MTTLGVNRFRVFNTNKWKTYFEVVERYHLTFKGVHGDQRVKMITFVIVKNEAQLDATLPVSKLDLSFIIRNVL
jgi:hypothetical protein